MAKKFLTIIFIIVLVVGAGIIGSIIGYGQIPSQANSNVLRFLNSKLANDFNVTLSGKIVSVSDTSLTIEANGESLSLDLPQNINVFKQNGFVSGASIPEPPALIKLGDLKAGDFVSVSVFLKADGAITALNVMLLPENSQSVSPLPVPAE